MRSGSQATKGLETTIASQKGASMVGVAALRGLAGSKGAQQGELEEQKVEKRTELALSVRQGWQKWDRQTHRIAWRAKHTVHT